MAAAGVKVAKHDNRSATSKCGSADILELGFPFSDPVADGPIIQEANNITLKNGINTDNCFQLLEEIRKTSDIPIGLLIYANL